MILGWGRRAAVLTTGVWAVLLAGCTGVSGSADADGADADTPMEELSPCEAAMLEWRTIWQIRTDSSGLSGRTPDINLSDVWGPSADEIYAVGNQGTILHYNGSGWARMESGTEADLEGVWGYQLKDADGNITRTDVFAAGSNGTILRYDGTAWSSLAVISDPDPAQPNPQPVTDSFHDVWGIRAPGPDPATQHPTVIAVGGKGLIARFEGDLGEFREMRRAEPFTYPVYDDQGNIVGEETRISYVRFTPERLGGVYGPSQDLFVAVGNSGTILEGDGTGWAKQSITGFVTHLNGVWGRGAWEIFGVGLEGTIARRNGSGNWSVLDLDTPPTYLRSVWAWGQSKCGAPRIEPDADPVPTDTSWTMHVGWEGTVLMSNNHYPNLVCEWPDVTSVRLEAIWGHPPRSEGERTLEDETVVCDPVEAVAVGVDGTIIRFVDALGR